MPASITHMLIAKKTRHLLSQDDNRDVAAFANQVLDSHPHYMELGSLGPDLPYFGWRSLIDSNKPRGVDHWSYQLHSKDPNLLPLKMIELIWRESNPMAEDWEKNDKCKLAFLCGCLTHIAADQTIHPVVNNIAGGAYCQRKDVRRRHLECEVFQDIYLLSLHNGGSLSKSAFRSYDFDSWCDPKRDGWLTEQFSDTTVFDFLWKCRKTINPLPCPIEFIYFLQRAFVEAHSVTPKEDQFASWIKTLQKGLRLAKRLPLSWYNCARKTLFDDNGILRTKDDSYRKFIMLTGLARKEHDCYDEYIDEAVGLAAIYVRAAYELSRAPRLDDDLRTCFRKVIVNADLGVPLQLHIYSAASESISALSKLVDEKWTLP